MLIGALIFFCLCLSGTVVAQNDDLFPAAKLAVVALVIDTPLSPCLPGEAVAICAARWRPCDANPPLKWLTCYKDSIFYGQTSDDVAVNITLRIGGSNLNGWQSCASKPETCMIPRLCVPFIGPCYSYFGIIIEDVPLNRTLGTLNNAPGLVILVLNRCRLEGQIPEEWGMTLFGIGGLPSTLFFMELSSNFISGTLPNFNGAPALISLRVGYNRLSGTFPNGLAERNSLYVLDVSNNKMDGTFPTVTIGLALNLNGNRFIGDVPRIKGECNSALFRNNFFNNCTERDVNLAPRLRFFDIGFNNITGTIPKFLYTAFPGSQLGYVFLSANKLTGTLPTLMSPAILYFDLANNMLTGTINVELPQVAKLSTRAIVVDYNRLDTETIIFKPTDIVFLASRQDENECEKNISNCTQVCVDGWNPLLSYTCGCFGPGWRLQSDLRTCEDINECRPESPLQHNCTRVEQCVNTDGSFFCCPDGYQAAANGQCVDIDECRDNEKARTKCFFGSEQCFNLPGSFDCCNTTQRYNQTSKQCEECFNYNDRSFLDQDSSVIHPVSLFPSLKGITNHRFYWQFCSQCNSGNFVIQLSSKFYSCGTTVISSICEFACSNLSSVNSADGASYTLDLQFQKKGSDSVGSPTFLNDVLSAWGVTATFPTTKRAASNQLNFKLSSCSKAVTDAITSLAHDILPNAPPLDLSLTASCDVTMTYKSAAEPQSIIVPLIAGIAVGLFLLLLVVIVVLYFFWRLKNRVDWSILPPEVVWGYRQYEKNPSEWDFRGSKHSNYHYKEFAINSKEFLRVKDLVDKIGGREIILTGIIAVYNPTLVLNFMGAVKIIRERLQSSSALFGRQEWRTTEDQTEMELRNRCYALFEQRKNIFAWNQAPDAVPILPMLHGTDLAIGEKIAETGFASLSSIDEGFYGKGIYFTTMAPYTIPYLGSKQPCILLSWGVPGNTYPVIEHHTGTASLLGTALKSGYNSHYVRTIRDGTVAGLDLDPDIFDEIVITQESQIAPAYILLVDPKTRKSLLRAWKEGGRRDKQSLQQKNDPTASMVELSFDV